MWARYLFLALPALGGIELLAHWDFAGRAPRSEEWQALRPALERSKEPRDLVVIAPGWAEPMARQAFGDVLMPLGDVARADVSGYSRAILVSALGERSQELSGWRLLSERTEGRFALRVLQNPKPARVRYSFVESLGPEASRVSVVLGTEEESCSWTTLAPLSTGGLGGEPTFPRERFRCSGGPEYFVGVTVIDDENYRPRRCIWAHPPVRGALHIRYFGVPLGRSLHGYVGLPYLITRDGAGTTVELRVNVGDRPIGKIAHSDERGWESFDLSVGGDAQGSSDVEFQITSQNPHARSFCFYADMR
jgi:hypothetical protein